MYERIVIDFFEALFTITSNLPTIDVVRPLHWTVLIFTFWFGLGAAWLVTDYYSKSKTSSAQIETQINQLAGAYTDISAFVDHLPSMFSKNLNAAAFKITDDANTFIGAMYDSRRISTPAYNEFLKAKLNRENVLYREYRTIHWQSKTRRLKIIALYLPMANFADYTRYFSFAGFGFTAWTSFIVFAGLIMGMGIYYFLETPQSKQTVRFNPGNEKRPLSSKATAAQTQRKQNSNILSESRIRRTLDELRTITQSPHIGFFIRSEEADKSAWKGILELRNELVIRGDSIAIPELLNLTRVPENIGVIHSADHKNWFIGNDSLEKSSVLFSFTFEIETKLNAAQCEKALTIVKNHLREMRIEQNYEQAILDQLTGLYAAPYAFFSIKEKLQNQVPFSVMYLKFAENLSDENLQTVSHYLLKIARSHYDASEAPLIARLEMNQFLIVQNTKKDSSAVGRDLFHQQLFNFGNQTSQLKLAMGVISDASGFANLKTLLQTLDALAEKSFAQKKVVDLESSSRIGVI